MNSLPVMETDPMPPKFTVFAIAGYAGAGKDTMADAMAEHLPPGIRYTKIKMADGLKGALGFALAQLGLDVDPYTEDRKVKEKLRPLMMEFGRYCRSVDKGVFANKVVEVILPLSGFADVVFVPDMRYLNEHTILREVCAEHGWRYRPIYVHTGGVRPANDEEDESICDLLNGAMGELDDLFFDHGDLEGIEDAAAAIIHSLYE